MAVRADAGRRRLLRGVGLLPLALAFSCRGDGPSTLTIFAASSLTDAFTEIEPAFVADGNNFDLSFNFASSATLATQLIEGAPADVFASADRIQAERANTQGLTAAPVPFATNGLAVAAAAGSGIGSFADLGRPGLRLVVAHQDVPVGRYTRELLDRAAADPAFGPSFVASVLANVRSEELNARAVVAKVALGEADAGIVYRTDIGASAGLAALAVPPGLDALATYLAARVLRGSRPAGADAFIAFLQAGAARGVFERLGFGPPP